MEYDDCSRHGGLESQVTVDRVPRSDAHMRLHAPRNPFQAILPVGNPSKRPTPMRARKSLAEWHWSDTRSGGHRMQTNISCLTRTVRRASERAIEQRAPTRQTHSYYVQSSTAQRSSIWAHPIPTVRSSRKVRVTRIIDPVSSPVLSDSINSPTRPAGILLNIWRREHKQSSHYKTAITFSDSLYLAPRN